MKEESPHPKQETEPPREIRSGHFEQPDAEETPFYIIRLSSTLYRAIFFTEMLVLLYTASISPVVFAYEFSKNIEAGLNVADYVADTLFFLIMCTRFVTSIYDQRGIPVYSVGKISKHYLKKWFWLDLISVLPVPMLGIVDLSMIRIFRIPHTLKDKRDDEMADFFDTMDKVIANSKQKLRMIVLVSVYMHLIVCMWMGVSRIEALGGQDNWMDRNNIGRKKFLEAYVSSAYFVLETVSTIGYGDLVPITPIQIIMTIVIIQIGVVAYSLVVGNVINSIRTSSIQETEHHQKLEYVNELAKILGLSNQLKKKIQSSIKGNVDESDDAEIKAFLRKLPIQMRTSISCRLYDKIIKAVPYLNRQLEENKNKFLVGELCLYLEPVILQKGDTIFNVSEEPEDMYFVCSGKISVLLEKQSDRAQGPTEPRSILLKKFQTIGDVSLLIWKKRLLQFRAESDLLLYRLHKDHYNKIFRYLFPKEQKILVAKAEQRNRMFECMMVQNGVPWFGRKKSIIKLDKNDVGSLKVFLESLSEIESQILNILDKDMQGIQIIVKDIQ